MSSGLEDLSLFDLFRMEAEEQVRVLQAELIRLEEATAAGTSTVGSLEALMRAAHSIKGAARIVGLDPIVHLTHAVEDRFVAAQAGRALSSAEIDRMLVATDWLARLQGVAEAETQAWLDENTGAIEAFAASFAGAPAGGGAEPLPASLPVRAAEEASPVQQTEKINPAPAAAVLEADASEDDIFAQRTGGATKRRERTVRISADGFDRILSLASDNLVSMRRLVAHGEVLAATHRAFARSLQAAAEHVAQDGGRSAAMRDLERHAGVLASQLSDLEVTRRANVRTAERLHRIVLAGRLRPFSDGVTAVARMVRDTARDLGKQVRLEMLGESTRVDRDILERLEAPISHLIANAIDHGIETPELRMAAGKTAEAKLRLQARHENGRLVITVRDDGAGIPPERVRERIVARGLVTAETAAGLSDAELMEFLFLPGFSTREAVSAVSGRGVGLNVVQSMVQEAGGSVTVASTPGEGTVFRVTLPVTRSVIKVIRVQAEGDIYAVPLVRIDRVAHLEPIAGVEPPAVELDGKQVPMVSLAALLGISSGPLAGGMTPVLVCGGVAFAVEWLVDEVELPVRRLDARLGKIPGVSAASLDENGLPLLILDMEDLIQTALGGTAGPGAERPEQAGRAPHILVVDDSHTVREQERRLLVRAGYRVTTAQNGQEAWNLLRMNDYDLLISDVDMPQMNGIELVTRLRENSRLGSMPVIILSYKDREEDRRRGLDAGADFYLTKGDFHGEAFRQAVVDLIGTAEPLGAEVRDDDAGEAA